MHRFTRAITATLLTATVMAAGTACSIPSRPAWWHDDAGPASFGADPSPVVAKPWVPGMRQLGVNVLWYDTPGDPDTWIRAKARRILDYAIGLGANAVSVSIPVFTSGATASAVYADPLLTPSPNRVAILLEEAAKSRVRVTLRPLLDERTITGSGGDAWRGSITPDDRDAWFRSYTALITPYARVAAAGGAATFTVGVELVSLQSDPHWAGLTAAVKAVFGGEIDYSGSYEDFIDRKGRGLPIEADVYPSLNLPDNADLDALTAGWNAWLDRKAAGPLPGLVMSEVGIVAQNGGFQRPWDWQGTASALNLTVQKNWYDAACRIAKQRNLAGLYWWKVDFSADPARADPRSGDRLTFLGRPAEQAVKNCFTVTLAGPRPT